MHHHNLIWYLQAAIHLVSWCVGEQKADRLSVVCPANGLSQGWRDIDSLKLWALLLLALHWDSVGSNDSAELRVVDDLTGLAGEDAMGDQSNNLLCAVVLDGLGGLGQGTAGIGHIVNEDGGLALDISNENHAGDLVWTSTLLVDKCELKVESVGDRGSALSSTSIWGNNNAVLDVEVLADPTKSGWLSVQVVNWDVEESLDLGCVKIHCDNVVTASGLEHVCNQLRRDWCTRLVLLILASVWEVWDNSGDAASRCGLAGIDHDQELHEAVVDLAWGGGLENENCRRALA